MCHAMLRNPTIAIAFMASAMIFPTPLVAMPLDIGDTGGFVVSDSTLVSFGPAINQAVLLEDALFGVTYLSNDPFLGDPGIFLPADAVSLTFDYSFTTTGSDSFQVNLLDASGAPLFFSFLHDGVALGAGSFSGEDISVDLLTLSLPGNVVGLDFVMTSNIGDPTIDAVLSISDVQINTAVPEPAIIALFLAGLLLTIISNLSSRQRARPRL
ncbi:MAG: PEP-CTERM sorting domain-containing protein [Thiohalocapsa sp. PB-PSB1]|jgi:hypothetical protein|nr:MAG: PEP-CTERM sorting domain-containing protein [Thiohalocapsa sp. PB-PSB1]